MMSRNGWNGFSAVAMLIVAVSSACGIARISRAVPLVGPPWCYDLELGPWLPVERASEVHFEPPKHVIMDTTVVATPGSRGFSLKPAVNTSRPGTALWVRTAPDSILLYWGDGHAGITVRVEDTGKGELVGYAEATIDFERLPWPRASVKGTQVGCEKGTFDRNRSPRP